MSVRVLAADPPSPAVLGNWERWSVRVGYETDRPIQVRAEAFAGRERVTSITGGAPRRDPGTGEALLWFAFTEPAWVDRIEVWAEDAGRGGRLARAELEVELKWTGEPPAAARRPAEWVRRLTAEQEERDRAELQEYMDRPTPAWGLALFFGAMAAIPAYLGLQVLALWRLRGRWRLAVALPLVPMIPILAYTLAAFLAGSNLFPLVLLFSSPPAAVYLGAVLAARSLSTSRGGIRAIHDSPVRGPRAGQ